MDRETVEEIKRHFGIVVEDVRDEVRGVAEGVETLREEIRRELKDVKSGMAQEFEETRSLIRLSYGELDRRVKSLETEIADLRTRLERVEDRLAS
jgi:ABC-type phosphate transport system auxiliary subunit